MQNILKINGHYTRTIASLGATHGKHITIKADVPHYSNITMSKSDLEAFLKGHFMLSSSRRVFDITYYNKQVKEDLCILKLPINNVMQSFKEYKKGKCVSSSLSLNNWVFVSDFNSGYSPEDNIAFFRNEFYGATRVLTPETIRPTDIHGNTNTNTILSMRTYHKLLKVNGSYFPITGFLNSDGKSIFFSIENLPESPNISISWDDYYKVFMHRFRKPNGMRVDITRGAKQCEDAGGEHISHNNTSNWDNCTGWWKRQSTEQWDKANDWNSIITSANEVLADKWIVNAKTLVAETHTLVEPYLLAGNDKTITDLKNGVKDVESVYHSMDEDRKWIAENANSKTSEYDAERNNILQILEEIKSAFNTKCSADTVKGYWKYPTIKGLNYVRSICDQLPPRSTNNKGAFSCSAGETVAFYLGIIKVYEVMCGDKSNAPTITLIPSLP